MIKDALSPYIRTAMLSTLTAPFHINERNIFDYEIIYSCGGKCRITIDGTPYICQKGDVVFIRPGVTHKFESVGNTNYVQPHIHFDATYSEKSQERFISFKPLCEMTEHELSLVQNDVFSEYAIPPVFIPQSPERFEKIFFEIIDIFQSKKYNHELLCKAKMLELADCILSQFENCRAGSEHTGISSVVNVKNYIESNYLSVITLDSLADQFHMNKFTLLRNFKALFGQNVMEYYRQKRFEYAADILKNSSLPIGIIADKMSFSDIYSFSRFFKAKYGISPSDYRKKQK